MSVTEALIRFGALAALLTITPGLDTALVLHAVLRHGRRVAVATGAGICTGSFVWGVAAAVGVSALFAASEIAYVVLKLVGGGYLVFLGIRLLVKALKGAPLGEDLAAIESTPSGTAAFAKGLSTNLLNPKVAAFYIAVLPLFIPVGANPALMGAALAGVHAVETAVWFTAIILGAHSVRRWLARRRTQRVLDGVTGVTLMGFGVALGLSARA
jgi:threonine/homoserine/homoserine lactone efflux protein